MRDFATEAEMIREKTTLDPLLPEWFVYCNNCDKKHRCTFQGELPRKCINCGCEEMSR